MAHLTVHSKLYRNSHMHAAKNLNKTKKLVLILFPATLQGLMGSGNAEALNILSHSTDCEKAL